MEKYCQKCHCFALLPVWCKEKQEYMEMKQYFLSQKKPSNYKESCAFLIFPFPTVGFMYFKLGYRRSMALAVSHVCISAVSWYRQGER